MEPREELGSSLRGGETKGLPSLPVGIAAEVQPAQTGKRELLGTCREVKPAALQVQEQSL